MPFQWTREKKVELLLAVAKELDPFWDGIYVALGPRFMHMNRLDISSQYHHLTDAAARLIPLDEDAGASSSAALLASTTKVSSSALGALSFSASKTSATTAPSAVPPSAIDNPTAPKKRKGHASRDSSPKRNKSDESEAMTKDNSELVEGDMSEVDEIVNSPNNENRIKQEKHKRTDIAEMREGGEAKERIKEEISEDNMKGGM